MKLAKKPAAAAVVEDETPVKPGKPAKTAPAPTKAAAKSGEDKPKTTRASWTKRERPEGFEKPTEEEELVARHNLLVAKAEVQRIVWHNHYDSDKAKGRYDQLLAEAEAFYDEHIAPIEQAEKEAQAAAARKAAAEEKKAAKAAAKG